MNIYDLWIISYTIKAKPEYLTLRQNYTFAAFLFPDKMLQRSIMNRLLAVTGFGYVSPPTIHIVVEDL